jgi:hypothetical protein
MSGFSFRGVHSSKFGIYTQDTSRIILPPRREGKRHISAAPHCMTLQRSIRAERCISLLKRRKVLFRRTEETIIKLTNLMTI